MAIAFGAAIGEKHNSDNGTTDVFTTSASVPSGGKVIFNAIWFGTPTASSVSGGGLTWSIDKQGKSGSYGAAIISADAPAGLSSATAITITYSGATDTCMASAYYITGAATASFVDTTGQGNGTSTTLSASMTTTNADDLLATLAFIDGTGINVLPSPGSEVYDVESADGYVSWSGYQVVASTGTYSPGGSWTGSHPWLAVAVAYKASGGGATVADNSRRRRPNRLLFRGYR